MSVELLGLAAGCFLVGALLGLPVLRLSIFRYPSAAAAAVGSVLLVGAATYMLAGDRLSVGLPVSTPLGGFEIAGTALGGLFLLVIGVVGFAIAVYSSDYVIHVGGPPRQAALLVFFNLTLGSLAAIVVAGNALTFLLAWEAMSILTLSLIHI